MVLHLLILFFHRKFGYDVMKMATLQRKEDWIEKLLIRNIYLGLYVMSNKSVYCKATKISFVSVFVVLL